MGCFHCKHMCKLTPKEVAAELFFTVQCVLVNTKEVAVELVLSGLI